MIQIGSRGRSSQLGVTDLLLDCHRRIRERIALAERLAGARAPSTSEVREAAHLVRRYFDEALPLHVADEEETVLPRILGLDASVDAALEQMQREHGEHQTLVADLIDRCRALESEPERHRDQCDGLAAVAAPLASDLVEHLALEESIIVPAINTLVNAGERAAMLDEIRARRRGVFDAAPT